MFFSKEQVDRGRKIVNAGIVILTFLLIVSLIIDFASYDTGNLIKHVVIFGLVLINIFLYYKGNRIAFRITMFLLSMVYIFVFGLLPVYLILILLRMLNVLDAFGGALYLIIPAVIIITINVIIFKTDLYDDVLAFKTYYNRNIKK
ncbi:hypothetical protein [Thermosediminibacter litoriperuensis]|uniref:Uncharacterized protein n=1 Tax=Thermosediminibacter litoriperuensis TaxID=291989 RepID=A0A5S5ADH4_9FIRM|nr:hypothetical protein [Thermosediminibacter litoriperuensis]TYP47678.1 hypothetical protein LZ11_02399 [Thermosediminibacter litoriperuensis]